MVFKKGRYVQSAMVVDPLPNSLELKAVEVLKGSSSQDDPMTPRSAVERFTFLRMQFRNSFLSESELIFEDEEDVGPSGEELYCGGRFRLLNLGEANELTYEQIEYIFDDMGITIRGAMDEAYEIAKAQEIQEAEENGERFDKDTIGADRFHQHYLECEQKHVRRRFKAVDVGGDGRISKEDLNIVLIAMGVPKRDVAAIEKFAEDFQDDDAGMDYDNFIDWYYQFQRRQNFRGQDDDEIECYSDGEVEPLSEDSHQDPEIVAAEDKELDGLYEQLRAGNGLLQCKAELLQLLCKRAFKSLREDECCVQIGGEVTIVGDIHGQYHDLVRIFEKCGEPGGNGNTYLFLGDYVDRGDWSIEVITLLFLCKIKHPDKFFLLRGNHEDAKINAMYGFQEECEKRFNARVFQFFNTCFCMMPFCSIVNDSLFCVHAGISPSFESLAQINSIQRPCRIEPGITCDLVWADPNNRRSRESFVANKQRGTSFRFSIDATQDFLERLGLKRLIRAHELCDYGYQIQHMGQLFTIFSAPNYCGECENRGAVMKVYKDLTAAILFFDPIENPEDFGLFKAI